MKELTKKEFESTFSEKMTDITKNFTATDDVWAYIDELNTEKYNISKHVKDNKLIEKVYVDSHKTYEQILIPTVNKSVYLIIVISLKNKNVFGHHLLDLSKK
jgi:hypothetical protein